MNTVMAKHNSHPTNTMKAPEHPQYSPEWGYEPMVIFPQRSCSPSNIAPPPSSKPIQLELESLNCFEIVESQFLAWGITFRNAIALQPSNPAFVTQPEKIVLMSAPESGFLEISFQHPLRSIEARVTSSRPTVLSAFNNENQEIAQTQMIAPEQTEVVASVLSPTVLQINRSDIYKVTFCTFDGQLIIDDLKLQF